jgi:hypothetical protein
MAKDLADVINKIAEKAFQEDFIALIEVSEKTETFKDTFEGLLPFFNMGYDFIAYADNQHDKIYLLESSQYHPKPPTFTKEEIDKVLSLPPNSPVHLRDNLEPVAIYHFEIEGEK